MKQNLFDERFSIFWKKLNKKKNKKKKLNDEQKSDYKKVMFNHFNELNKNLDVHRSLYYVFHIPVRIINFNDRNQLRRSKDTDEKNYKVKIFLDVIKYFLENDVTEWMACKEILTRNKLKYEIDTFVTFFRKWYKDIWNQDTYSEISKYLIVFEERKMFKKNPIKNFEISDKPID